jgi:hypothetical protein
VKRNPLGLAAAVAAIVGMTQVGAWQGQAPVHLPGAATVRGTGQSVTGAFEGWYKNADGTFSLLVGYFNRNEKQEFDIPVGPNNRIEPGGPDRGQPTHFGVGRQYDIFAVTVPKDFGAGKLTWTLVSNGQTNAVTMHVDPNWVLEPFLDAGSGNKPPSLKFDPNGAALTGPPRGLAASLKATVGQPLPLTVWAADEGPRLTVASGEPGAGGGRGAANSTGEFYAPQQLSLTWTKYRGPGAVVFDQARPKVARADGKATATATFDAPGEYILRVQANDSSGDGGGFQCCWSNAHVRVVVTQ